MTTTNDSIILDFSKNGNQCEVYLDDKFKFYKHLKIVNISFCMNYKNIQTSFGNTRLYLKNDGSVFVDLVAGLYDIPDINDRVLSPAISGRFYKIITAVNGLSWSIYSYATANDRTNNTSGTL